MTPFPDPKWLEFLKAGGTTFTAIAVACGVLYFGSQRGWFPLDGVVLQAVIVAGVVSTCLALGAIFDAAKQASRGPLVRFQMRRRNRAELDRFVEYIPHLSDQEREILAHLLHHNQRTFTNTADGGRANMLLSMGFVRILARPGQQVDYFEVPFGVTDPVWKALQAHAQEFPYRPRRDGHHGERDVAPWRAPVM
ncbi:hypothetical protein [Inquilinus limosus]|uniref:hypothetical protein n=1 Tax=Inquilinus limosus TaxID=171674 RepID=UPI00119820BA|nr:hypothetical protein [Inquilinus limosus]